jgi:N-glycosylase/DNA lyase
VIAKTTFQVRDYDLASTLTSGQTFRWTQKCDGSWVGIVHGKWVRLRQPSRRDISAECSVAQKDWKWLEGYLQVKVDLEKVLETFPKDEAMTTAVQECRGLRLLQQDPWECLASFILSSTKQIVQIQQIVRALSNCFGEIVVMPEGEEKLNAFPTAQRIASATETELRACKMGFRAPYLRGTARMVSSGEVDLGSLYSIPMEAAREQLLRFPGVGRKIADCVLLFAYGFPKAFPIDVWVIKALRDLYFKKRKVSLNRLERFAEKHFGPNAGYAQQYLFHYMRVVRPLKLDSP